MPVDRSFAVPRTHASLNVHVVGSKAVEQRDFERIDVDIDADPTQLMQEVGVGPQLGVKRAAVDVVAVGYPQ